MSGMGVGQRGLPQAGDRTNRCHSIIWWPHFTAYPLCLH